MYNFAGLEVEPEQFTPDREWMPRLVLIAKNAYVWLEQLTRAYGRPITSLDQARVGISRWPTICWTQGACQSRDAMS